MSPPEDGEFGREELEEDQEEVPLRLPPRFPPKSENPLDPPVLVEMENAALTTLFPTLMPESISVFEPSTRPVFTSTGLGRPFSQTRTIFLPFIWEIAAVGTRTASSRCSVTIVTVAVMLLYRRSSSDWKRIFALYETTPWLVTGVGSTSDTAPVKVLSAYESNLMVAGCQALIFTTSSWSTKTLIS